jgi:hypothetical protein
MCEKGDKRRIENMQSCYCLSCQIIETVSYLAGIKIEIFAQTQLDGVALPVRLILPVMLYLSLHT